MSWAVAFTKPASEQLAARAIIEAGYRSYCPMTRVVLRGHRKGRGEAVLRPLFPRYIFAEMNEGRFVALVYSRGVVDLIRDADQRPQTLADDVIEDLRERERGGQFDAPAKAALFTPGAAVAVDGEWGSIVGKLISLDGESRARVLLNMLGREITANIGLDKLRATA